ncbi:hypothetical protein L598_000900000310 [Mesorhizobium sp. J18]|uniref:tRNA (adenosine(37)-N6)-threonylcarbamoyltransferase complex ATPase subunit type 1 TsaE n=1 Tax=Mesorhizobium sp. J18 TaxID=935263 RepID=UPI00119B814D|nr:tRNA (adenosine(37)-N6)-threonylcarbamoyltransferase complex ATPase subunit type 1 TsaE [Mesorhizobium sp. J18]TWG88952.1 hypothetical protein L598_000900000310 [Mesorhizobium sp. J18]
MAGCVLERHLPDEQATNRLGEDIAVVLKAGDVVALRGDLGAGKTTLARAIIRSLADDPALEVPSPTFTLVQAYETRIQVHHFDLYRLGSPEELEELGLDEAAASGVGLIEWPERAEGRITGAINVALREQGDGRVAEVSGPDAPMKRLAQSFAIREFLGSAGRPDARRAFLLGDASIRAYETITDGGEKLILMNAPERRDEPVVRDGLPYSHIARLAQSVSAFVAVDLALREAGLAAPEILAQDLARGLLLIEHLGSGSFLGQDGIPVVERYCAAAELLAFIHQKPWNREMPVTGGITHHLPPYDRQAFGIETELMLDWYVPFAVGRPASAAERGEFLACWSTLFDRLEKAEQSIVLRDFHSPNIIWRDDRKGFDRLGIIDFQDAVFGPAAYDVASLALDARVTIPPDLERVILDTYCAARGAGFNREAFEETYAIATAQRNSKLLGTFVRLDRRDGKPAYLKHLPRIRNYLRRSLHHPALTGLGAFYQRAGFLPEGEE